MRKGAATRERILEIARASVLQKGFGATSIDEIIAEAGITKSGFFYHFRDKNELAYELLARYVAEDERILDDIFGRAADLCDDPLQRFLVGLKLLAELLADMPGGHPGCMIASVCYQERLFDRRVVDFNRQAMEDMNRRFRSYLEEIAAVYPPREPVDLDQLARMICCAIDGSIILGKALGKPDILPEQLLMVRTQLKLLFQPLAANQPTREALAA